MNLVEGARYDEAADGTNGIGTALVADHAFQVFAFEHFNERHHQWVCSGAPVHDPVSGRTIGLIDLSSPWKLAHPGSLELVISAAGTIEQCLRDARRDRDARLRRRYSDFLIGRTDLLLDRDGYVLDGARLEHPGTFDIPDGGGEVVLGDGSIAVAMSLGQGEAYLLRDGTARRPKSEPVARLERAEGRARELVTEQAALRQVATLVARESSPEQLFAVVAQQVARTFDVPHVRLARYEPDSSVVVGGFSEAGDGPFPTGSHWPLDSPGVIATVRQTGHAARVDDYARLTGEIAGIVRDAGMRSAVASPIVVARRLWGAMVMFCERTEPLPADTEARLSDFTDLVATAIANAESLQALATLADEQAALRRVAMLVASGGGPEPVFRAVADEVQALFGCGVAGILRFEDDGTATTLGTHGDLPTAGTRLPVDPNFVMGSVRSRRRAARFETDDPTAASMPTFVRETGIRSAVANPIVVEGKLWGAIAVGSFVRSLPRDTERRLADFTELVATAVANIQAREQVRTLADEQAALRRVATLVAKEDLPEAVFAKVAEETGRLLGGVECTLLRSEPDGAATNVGTWGETISAAFPLGASFRPDGDGVAATVLRTGSPHRIDDYSAVADPIARSARDRGIESSVGCPIVVRGTIWGAIVVGTTRAEPFPPEAEVRLTQFADLVATAVANAEARGVIVRLADEQAALRRVATLVAQGVSQQDLFAAVAEEVGRLLAVGSATMGRYEPDETVTTMASWSTTEVAFPTGERWPTEGTNVAWMVLQTDQAARLDDFSAATDPIGVTAREAGMKSAVGSPIVVDGALWGVMTATSTEGALPPDTESRLASFTELVATAIANAESSAELAASRRRIVAASDDARRRIERDLHDGLQQRLVSLGLELGAMKADPPAGDALKEQLASVTEDVRSVLDALLETARGIHPAILSQGGLAAALRALARRSAVPVELHVQIEGPVPDEVEVAAYYVAAEALTNAAKHARASVVHIDAATANGAVRLVVRDDGVGGADPGNGSGLVGLRDRVEALGGAIKIDSSAGSGTGLAVTLPIAPELVQENANVLRRP
jgi:signal transduction histidine kinase